MEQAARAMIRVGAILLVMSLLARLVGLSAADAIGDDLAIVASLGVMVTGILYLRFSRR